MTWHLPLQKKAAPFLCMQHRRISLLTKPVAAKARILHSLSTENRKIPCAKPAYLPCKRRLLRPGTPARRSLNFSTSKGDSELRCQLSSSWGLGSVAREETAKPLQRTDGVHPKILVNLQLISLQHASGSAGPIPAASSYRPSTGCPWLAAAYSSQGFTEALMVMQKLHFWLSILFDQEAKPLIPAKEAALLLQLAGNQHIILFSRFSMATIQHWSFLHAPDSRHEQFTA